MKGVHCAEKKRYRKEGGVNVHSRSDFYIRYRENGELKTLKSSLHPKFKSRKEGEDWILTNAEHISKLTNRSDSLKHIAWKNKYHKFEELVKIFTIQQREDAPNSFESNVFYLESFILPYFLSERGLGDLNGWFREFSSFKGWLEQQTNQNGRPLAFSTQNGVIRTLNKFLSILAEKGKMDPHFALLKCKSHPNKKLNTRSYKDIIDKKQYLKLKESLGYSKEFFIILYNTGMRFNELFSLPYSSIQTADTLSPQFAKRIETLKKKIYGYIILESQIADKVRKREKDGSVKRKPLKSCHKIEAKNSRLIPITDKETWNIIVHNHNRADDEYDDRKHISGNRDDYFLLDLEYNKLRRDFSYHCKKGFHAARHSYVTNTIGESGMSETEIRLITGHRSDAYEKYVHIYEQFILESTKNSKKRVKLKIAA